MQHDKMPNRTKKYLENQSSVTAILIHEYYQIEARLLTCQLMAVDL